MDFYADTQNHNPDYLALLTEQNIPKKELIDNKDKQNSTKVINSGQKKFILHYSQLSEEKITLKRVRKSAKSNIKYIEKIEKTDSGLFNEILKNLKNANDQQIQDFFQVCQKIELDPGNKKDRESIIKLARITPETNKCSRLIYGADIRDNWFKKILENPNISFDDLKYKIMHTCKPQYPGISIKSGDLFAHTTPEGDILADLNQSSKYGESKVLGLVSHDTDFLSNYTMSVYNKYSKNPVKLSLKSSIIHGAYVIHNLEAKDLIIYRSQLVNKKFFDRIKLKNKSNFPKILEINLSSKVSDIFELRGFWTPESREYKNPVVTADNEIIINTVMEPQRELGIKVKALTDSKSGIKITAMPDKSAQIRFTVPAKTESELEISILPVINNKPYVAGRNLKDESSLPAGYNEALNEINKNREAYIGQIQTSGSNPELGKIIARSLEDINMLENQYYDEQYDRNYSYISAGIPKYACLFGRDSIISAAMLLPLRPELAKDTIELLAKYQGKSLEDRIQTELSHNPNTSREDIVKRYEIQEEGEGKILHELRFGELARERKIPHTPYYGTIDATPLWLMLVTNYYKWTKDDMTVIRLLPNIEKAIRWMEKNSDSNGFLKFMTVSGAGKLRNQGWKDSKESIKHIIGKDNKLSNPEYPIALAEVQGYKYAALVGISGLYKELGLLKRSAKLANDAAQLKKNFNDKFWMKNQNFIAIALDAKGSRVESISSNGAQTLFSGILDNDKAYYVAKKVMSDELNSGWGIRTLGKYSKAYDPMSYHNGSVWIHDNAIIIKGMPKYEGVELINNLYDSLSVLPDYSATELYAGFERKNTDKSVQIYPDSCQPQGWSASSVIYLLLTTLGLDVDTQSNVLLLKNPILPYGAQKITLKGIKFKQTGINLEIEKTSESQYLIKASNEEGLALPVEKSETDNTYRVNLNSLIQDF